MIRGLIRNIGDDWKEIGDVEKKQRRRILETIQEEEEEQEMEGPRVEEWNEEDEMGNLQDLYNEL